MALVVGPADSTLRVVESAFEASITVRGDSIILDEAQNSTPEQMKMFLTRLGFNSKMVVTGDLTQRDLPRTRSGLADAERVLGDIDDVSFCRLSGKDVVRHCLVAAIVTAYDRADA